MEMKKKPLYYVSSSYSYMALGAQAAAAGALILLVLAQVTAVEEAAGALLKGTTGSSVNGGGGMLSWTMSTIDHQEECSDEMVVSQLEEVEGDDYYYYDRDHDHHYQNMTSGRARARAQGRSRSLLFWKQKINIRHFISYGALERDYIPCTHRGASYYYCHQLRRVNPYRRGCSRITRCRQ